MGLYYLIGGGATYNPTLGYNNPDSPYYEQNKAVLLDAFGSSNCTESNTPEPGQKQFSCSGGTNTAIIQNTGRVSVSTTNWRCSVFSDNEIYCDTGIF